MSGGLSEEEKELYLEVLRESPTPFDRFVSRGDIEDVIDISSSRKTIDRSIFRAIAQTQLDQSTRLIPILGAAGAGKTHAYWAYKDKERRAKSSGVTDTVTDGYKMPDGPWSIVYVPSPPASYRILLHVYTCMIDELGSEIIAKVSEKLVERWGGKKKKHLGLFGSADINEVVQAGIKEYPGVFADCVKALVIFNMDKDRRALAERWLLGEELDEEELKILQIGGIIEDDDTCLAMIKIISEHTDEALLLYFDELESPYRMHGAEAERKFLEVLKRLYNEVKNMVIVIAVLKEIWPRILEIADKPLISRMEPERELQKWSFDDLKLFFAKSMMHFWNSQNLNPPSDPLFPLNDAVLQTIYAKADGNQRSIIKLIRIFVDKIIMGDMTLTELMKDEEIKAHAQKPVPKSEIDEEIKKMAKAAAQSSEKKKKIASEIDKMMQEEDFIIDVNPSSVAAAALKCVKILGDKHGKDYKVDMDFKFLRGRREVSLAGFIGYDGRKIAIELPSLKSFDRPGGVSAYYAVKRLLDASEQEEIDEGILLTSVGTKGQKYQSILNQNPHIEVVEMDEEQAELLLRGAAAGKPSKEGYEFVGLIFKDLPEYKEEPEDAETSE